MAITDLKHGYESSKLYIGRELMKPKARIKEGGISRN